MEAYIQTNALLVYAIVMVAAALLHWGQKVRKGEASSDFMAYWFTETPGYSLGTFGALIGAWWLIYTTNGLDKMAAHMVVEGAFATGWMINSAVSPGSAPARAVAAAADKAAGFARLSILPLLVALAIAASMLTGCGTQMTVHPTGQENVAADPVKATKNLIDEANAGLAAAYRTVLSAVQSGAFTRDEAQRYKSRLDQASGYVDQAAAFIGAGDVPGAQGQLQLANSILALVQSELIKLKQEGK